MIFLSRKYKGNLVMKKTVTKLTLGLTSTAILATVGAQTVHANSYVVQDGDSFFAIATANGMDPYDLAALNGKTIFDCHKI